MVKNLQRDSGALSTETKTLASAQQMQAHHHTLSVRWPRVEDAITSFHFKSVNTCIYLVGFRPKFLPLCGKELASHYVSLAQGQ